MPEVRNASKKTNSTETLPELERLARGGTGLLSLAFLAGAASIPEERGLGIVLALILLMVMPSLIFPHRIASRLGRNREGLHSTIAFFMMCSQLTAYAILFVVTLLAYGPLTGIPGMPVWPALIAAFVTNWIARKTNVFGKPYADRVGNWLLVATGVAIGAFYFWAKSGPKDEAHVQAALLGQAIFGVGLVINSIITGRPTRPGPSRYGVRGRGLVQLQEAARQIFERFGENFKRGINWGGLQLPDEASTVHFYVAGSPGSGKTLALRALIAQVFVSIHERPNQRAVIYDPKQEFLPLLAGLSAGVPVVVINPLDRRSTPWNLSHDFTDDASAEQLAAALIPEGKAGDRYWTSAPRSIVAGVVKGLNHTAPLNWRLRDVLLIVRSPVLIKKYFESRPDLAHLAELHLGNDKTATSLLSQLIADLAPYEVVAALWDHLERQGVNTTAVRYFVQAPKGVVVFSNDPKYSAVLSPFYRLFVSRLSEEIRSPRKGERVVGGEPSPQRTWVIIDEAATIGKVPGLIELLAEGRSFGACVALGFQDIHHLYSVYGKDETNAILGQIGNRAVLRTENAVTADLMAQQFSKREVVQTSRTQNAEGGVSVSSSYGEEQLVLGKQIQDLPRPIPGPLVGYFSSSFTDAYVGIFTAEQLLMSKELESSDVPQFLPHPDCQNAQRLRPWDAEDEKRLGIKVVRRNDVPEDELAKAREARKDAGAENRQKRKSGFFDDIA